MTTLQIAALINSDAQAKTLYDANDFSGCATRLTAIAPSEIIPGGLVTEIGALSSFATIAEAETVLAKIESVANGGSAGNVTAQRIVRGLRGGGVNLYNSEIRKFLTASLVNGGCNLTRGELKRLSGSSERDVVITEGEVRDVKKEGRL